MRAVCFLAAEWDPVARITLRSPSWRCAERQLRWKALHNSPASLCTFCKLSSWADPRRGSRRLKSQNSSPLIPIIYPRESRIPKLFRRWRLTRCWWDQYPQIERDWVVVGALQPCWPWWLSCSRPAFLPRQHHAVIATALLYGSSILCSILTRLGVWYVV